MKIIVFLHPRADKVVAIREIGTELKISAGLLILVIIPYKKNGGELILRYHHFELFYWPQKINMAKKRKTAGFIEFCPLPSMVNFKSI